MVAFDTELAQFKQMRRFRKMSGVPPTKAKLKVAAGVHLIFVSGRPS
jgi:hypothetical protein